MGSLDRRLHRLELRRPADDTFADLTDGELAWALVYLCREIASLATDGREVDLAAEHRALAEEYERIAAPWGEPTPERLAQIRARTR